MDIAIDIDYELAFRLGLSFIIGTAIGLERELRSKAAGLRTMIMICVGSTIFTEISLSISDVSPDRIAASVITGIGFLGAGVIFKDGLSINGITTATTIWICAALGMAVGVGEYFVALLGSIAVLIVLIALEKVKLVISKFHQARSYKIITRKNSVSDHMIEEKIKSFNLRFQKNRDYQDADNRHFYYEIFGREKALEQFNAYLRDDTSIQSFEY
jgi:putative Mg2+ transporter-C (MgtC) family protein